MCEELAGIVKHIDNAGGFIEDDNGGGSQSQAAGLDGSIEIQRSIEFLFRQEAHAEAAGDAAFRLAAFPDSAGMLTDQLTNRHAEGQLDTAGLVDVAAD